MAPESKPYLGFTQPRTESNPAVAFLAMGRRSKKLKPVTQIRGILAKNVRKLRDVRFAAIHGLTERNKELAKLAECSPSQIQRICGEVENTTGVSIDYVEWVADALGVTAADLMTPNLKLLDLPEHRDNKLDRSPGSTHAAQLQRGSGR